MGESKLLNAPESLHDGSVDSLLFLAAEVYKTMNRISQFLEDRTTLPLAEKLAPLQQVHNPYHLKQYPLGGGKFFMEDRA